MGKKVLLHVHRPFVFSFPHTGEVGDVKAGRERHFKAGVHELDLDVDDDAAVVKHKWIQEGADGRIDLGGSRKASIAANLPPPVDPRTPLNAPGETLGLTGDEQEEDTDETDALLARAKAEADAAAAAAAKTKAPPAPPPPAPPKGGK